MSATERCASATYRSRDSWGPDGYSCPLPLGATEVGNMSSSSVGQVLPTSAFSYAVSLRARHPTCDLKVLTEALRLEPAHSWTAGEPRRSQTGAPLGGQHRYSYWSAMLPAQLLGPSSMPLEQFLGQQLVQLTRHRDCFSKLQADGGEISPLIELS